MDGSWMPLPTRPQRYCDPASLVKCFELQMPDWSQMKDILKQFQVKTRQTYLFKVLNAFDELKVNSAEKFS